MSAYSTIKVEREKVRQAVLESLIAEVTGANDEKLAELADAFLEKCGALDRVRIVDSEDEADTPGVDYFDHFRSPWIENPSSDGFSG